MLNPYAIQEAIQRKDMIYFVENILGMFVHPGQKRWFEKSTKPINILKPANQWGKTTAEAIKHIYEAVVKSKLDRFDMSPANKQEFGYLTLNVGKTYEISKGVQEQAVDIAEGKYLLPNGKYNKSLLKGWAIRDNWDAPPRLPQIIWWNHSRTLIRSYDGLGEAFKRLRLAFISADECGDIPELKLFLNGTILPRLFFFQGSVDLVGTSQPKGVEYEEIAEEAEEIYKEDPDNNQYFVISAKTDPEMASVYANIYMPKESIQNIEAIADPELRKQIIYGQYVDWSKHLYTWDEVSQMFKTDLEYDVESGFSEEPKENEYYAFGTDLAASEDETSCTCIRYNIRSKLSDGTFKYYPHRVVFHKAWKGDSFPLSVQYEMIKQIFLKFKIMSPARTKFIFDAGSLGGKNVEQAFKELHGYPFPPKGRSYAEIKAEGMGKVKEVLGRNREFIVGESGKIVDKNPDWGGIKASPKIAGLRRQLEIASKDDDKIKNDQYTSFMMALHYIEMRAPKSGHYKAVNFNYMRGTVINY